MITSTTNERVKLARALLTDVKARRKAGLIALEGVRLVSDALNAGVTPEFLLFNPEQIDPTHLNAVSSTLLGADASVIKHISGTEHPQGIVGVFPMPSLPVPQSPRRVLILDALRDPGNVGTILRTAAAAGVEVVLFSPGCVDAYNDKVLRGGMGAHFRIALRDFSWDEIESFTKDTGIYLADIQGDVTYDAADWSAAWSLIVGSEADGASADAERIATQKVFIPMSADSESLNAAVATGIILFEAAKHK